MEKEETTQQSKRKGPRTGITKRVIKANKTLAEYKQINNPIKSRNKNTGYNEKLFGREALDQMMTYEQLEREQRKWAEDHGLNWDKFGPHKLIPPHTTQTGRNVVKLNISHEQYFRDAIEKKDFRRFAGYCRVLDPEKKQFFYFNSRTWNEAQKKFNKERTGKDIVLKARRIGFTTMELIRDLFYALANDGSTVFICTQDQKLAYRAIDAIKDIILGLEDIEEFYKIDFGLPIDKNPNNRSAMKWNASEIKFLNGSKIIADNSKGNENASDKMGRGIGITRLHCTETAFWQHPDSTMTVLLNALDGDELIVESTPKGAGGWFYQKYKQSERNEWDVKNHFFPWHAMKKYNMDLLPKEKREVEDFMKPRNQYESDLISKHKITPEQMKWFRKKVSENTMNKVLQEFPMDAESCFRSTDSAFINLDDSEYIDKSIKDPIRSEQSGYGEGLIYIWQDPIPTGRYILGADVSHGIGKDNSAICVIEQTTGQIVCTYAAADAPPTNFAKIIHDIAKKYNNAYCVIECQSPGDSTINYLVDVFKYRNLYRQQGKEYFGFRTDVSSRPKLFGSLRDMIKEKTCTVEDIYTIEEIRGLQIIANRVDHAKDGKSDRVFAFMLAHYGRSHKHSMGGDRISISTSNKSVFGRSHMPRARL